MNKFVYIPVNNDSKIAAVPYGHLTETPDKKKFTKYNNRAILTGAKSNIIVVDIDKKDKGIETWNKYIKEHGDINTVMSKTPNDGFHYYFKYIPILSTNRTKINGVGIDIRSNGGYIMAPPSTIKDKKYEWVRSPEDNKILDMPEWLISILVKSNLKSDVVKVEKKEVKVKEANSTPLRQYIYPIDSEDLKCVINKLPKAYCDEFDKWLMVTNILWSVKEFIMWDEWSKQSARYDQLKNIVLWNSQTPLLNVNYLFYILNKELKLLKQNAYKYISPTINYRAISDESVFCKTRVLSNGDYLTVKNKKYLNIPEYIKNYDAIKLDGKKRKKDIEVPDYKTMIIKSDTGTGKTTSTAEYVSKTKYRLISIVSRQALVGQQIKTFRDKGVTVSDYRKNFKEDDNISIQLDSILKIEEFNLDNTVVYLDEVNSLISYLIGSDTLKNNRIRIYMTLLRIVAKCKVLICTDADVSDLVFAFLKDLRDLNDTIYIDNPFKNYCNIIAYHEKDEVNIIENMKQHVQDKEYFICCFDSKTRMEDVFQMVITDAGDQKRDFVKYSCEEGDNDDFERINDAWKNKYVFYTPKIIYGIDFSPDISQDVFIISTGNTINPLQIVQQMTRCRNIKSIHFFFSKVYHQLIFEDPNDVSVFYNNFYTLYEAELKNYGLLCYDESTYETKVIDNRFSRLFFLNKFQIKLLESSYLYHFKCICLSKGIAIQSVGVDNVIDKKTKKEYREIAETERKKIIKDAFEHLKEKGDDTLDNNQLANAIQKRMKICNITSNSVDEHPEFKDIITEDKEFKNHLNFCKLISTDSQKIKKFKEKQDLDFKEHASSSCDAKIALCSRIEKILNIGTLDISHEKHSDKYLTELVNTDILPVYQKMFTVSRQKPITRWLDLYKILISCYKGLCGESLFIYKQSKKVVNGKRVSIPIYTINDEYVKLHYSLMTKRQYCINEQFAKDHNLIDTNIEKIPDNPIPKKSMFKDTKVKIVKKVNNKNNS